MKVLLKNKSFMFIWIAYITSGLGSTFSIFIMGWVAYHLKGSAVTVGNLWFFYFLSSIISQIICGPYIDRVNKKNIMIFSELVRAIVYFFFALSMYQDSLTTNIIYTFAIIVGLVEPLFSPSSNSYIAETIQEKDLQKANSILQTTKQSTRMLGPLLAGLIVSMTEPLYVLIFLIVILGLSSINLLFLPNLNLNKSHKAGWGKEFIEGLMFYKKNPFFLTMGILLFIINFSAGAVQPMLLPYVFDYLKGTSFHYGLINSGTAFGMLIGAFFMTISNESKKLKLIMFSSIIIGGLSLSLLGISFNIFSSFLFITIYGLCASIFNINNTILYQKRVPTNLRGRVFTVRGLLANAGVPLGALVIGHVVGYIKINHVFLLLGLAIVIPCCIALFLPSLNYREDKEMGNSNTM
ncbi:MFS transporter [Priestia megaterium]|uniref:MFS transporter n=1 Tax=Priestia megaterium TaxID=1404 RepID=UPI00207A3495|nr:MFS transporter [Priestia megaterium]USL45551.1 MFS transporter [Priestia megaterium]